MEETDQNLYEINKVSRKLGVIYAAKFLTKRGRFMDSTGNTKAAECMLIAAEILMDNLDEIVGESKCEMDDQ